LTLHDLQGSFEFIGIEWLYIAFLDWSDQLLVVSALNLFLHLLLDLLLLAILHLVAVDGVLEGVGFGWLGAESTFADFDGSTLHSPLTVVELVAEGFT